MVFLTFYIFFVFPVNLISSEATWKVSGDDINNLKQGLVSIFNDIFSRQLVETTQVIFNLQ